ncbi:hypothetical protein C8J55DRAFT_310264 [Lentinula edodes]|uniref:Uncharacterized protein n=1 Tax=Lentinula lateritia TaxID=40482 RepID=A0A9W8ZP35_9AGAR|nr:hypothetical protein C8J55DRAFT_310264 [Lentinula edodes]
MQFSSHSFNGTSSGKAATLGSISTSDAPSPSTLPMLPKRAKKSSRPATAPAKEDVVLLPSLQPSGRMRQPDIVYANLQALHEDDSFSDHTNSRPESSPTTPFEPASSSTMQTSSSTVTMMQEPHSMLRDSTSHPESSLSSSQQSVGMFRNYTNTYDWAVFISAYASGRWDPHRTPNPPNGLGHSLSPQMRMLGGMTLSRKPEDDENDEVEQNRTPTANTPSVTSSENVSPVSNRLREWNELSSHAHHQTSSDLVPQLHRSPSSFPSSSGASRASHLVSIPLGSSRSADSPAENFQYPPQKAKAGLFLNLPNLLSMSSNSGISPGLEPSPASPSPLNVALQSNALHSNMHHSSLDDSSPSSRQSKTTHQSLHSTSEPPSCAGSVQLPTTPSKFSTPSRAPTISGYPLIVPASATAAHFSSSQLHSNSSHLPTSSRPHSFPNAPTLNAATLRLAGTHVNISPLALPSPEHELTDPMRAVGAPGRNILVTVPGTVPEDIDSSLSSSEDGSPFDRVLVDDDFVGASSSGKELFRTHSRNSSTDVKKFADGGDGRESGRWLDSSESTGSLVITPGGTTRRIRISQEQKKFWKGTRDVDRPLGIYGQFSASDSHAIGSPLAKGKGKTVKIHSPALNNGDDDYFTRGREFSAASSSQDGGQRTPKVNVGTADLEAVPLPSRSPSAEQDSVDDGLDQLHPLTIFDRRQLATSSQSNLSSSQSNCGQSGNSDVIPTSIYIPKPALSAYSFPYPHDRAQVVPHPSGTMSVPVPTITNDTSRSDAITAISNPSDSDSSIDGQLVRRMTLVRQSSAPLPVDSGSNSLLKGSMAVRMPMPPRMLPSLNEAEKSELALVTEDSFSSPEASESNNNHRYSAAPSEKPKISNITGRVLRCGLLRRSKCSESSGILWRQILWMS